jgi:ketosteroid isomerase-like protein
MRLAASLLGSAVALAVSCAPALAQDIATIQKLENAFAEAVNKADATLVSSMYLGDAFLLPPDHESIRGRSDIATFWKKAVQTGTDLKLTTLDVQSLASDAAREIGSISRQLKTQPPRDVQGKYVIIWRKIGTEWTISTDIWNGNNAP